MAHSGNPTKFLTLTIKATGLDPATEAQMLSDAFKNLIKRWRRHKPGKEIEYLAVFEPHPSSGRPHMHVIMRAPYTDQTWISAQMLDLLDSPVVDIRAVSKKRVIAHYISKYITKANTKFGKLKRYWHSKNWEAGRRRLRKSIEEGGSGWDVIRTPLFMIAGWWQAMGLKVVWSGEHEARAGPLKGGGLQWMDPPWEIDQ